MHTSTLSRMLLVLIVQAVLTIAALFVEGPDTWSWTALIIAASIPPLLLLGIYMADFRKLTTMNRVLLGAAVLLGFTIAGFFLFLMSIASFTER